MERLSIANSLLVAVVGILVVFLGLCILIALIKILAVATQSIGKKAEKPAAKPAAPAPAPAPVVEETVEDDDALIAVIAAAVACMMDEGTGFVVRRVRRVSAAPAWNRAGREEQMMSRF